MQIIEKLYNRTYNHKRINHKGTVAVVRLFHAYITIKMFGTRFEPGPIFISHTCYVGPQVIPVPSHAIVGMGHVFTGVERTLLHLYIQRKDDWCEDLYDAISNFPGNFPAIY